MNKLPIQHNTRAGFTLIELLIVMSIVPVLVMALTITMTLYPRKYAEIEQDRTMMEQASSALGYIGKDIRSAREVASAAGSYSSGEGGSLALDMGADNLKKVVWTTHDGALERIEYADSDARQEIGRTRIVAPVVSLGLVFDSWPPTTSRIHLEIKLSRQVMNQTRTINVSGNYFLRGKFK